METKKRTIVRMVTYRLTGNIASATGFATALHILLSIDYYIHERIWLKIKWGRIE
jgi:uncharacterized membrane protein